MPKSDEDIARLIERAAQPLASKPEKLPRFGGYTDKQTRSRNTGDTSAKHNGKSHPKSA